MAFPATRLRRLRRTDAIRAMVRETQLDASHLIAPLFVRHGQELREPIPSMPGQFHLSIDRLIGECRELQASGVPGVILFGLPDRKDEAASEAYAEDGVIQLALTRAAASRARPGADDRRLSLPVHVTRALRRAPRRRR